MASKSPLDAIKDAAVGTAKDPVGTVMRAAGQVVGHAQGVVALGKVAVDAVVPGRSAPAPTPTPVTEPDSTPVLRAVPSDAAVKTHGDPLPPAAPAKKAAAKKAPAKKAPATKAPAKKAAVAETPLTSIDASADPEQVDVTPADVARAVKKTPAKKTRAKKTAAKTTAAKTTPARKTAAKKSSGGAG